MAMTAPEHEVGTGVYLKESAALGFIEAVVVSGVRWYNGSWVYSVSPTQVLTPAPAYGDRISFINNAIVWYTQDELITLCAALALAEVNALAAYERVLAQRQATCPDATE